MDIIKIHTCDYATRIGQIAAAEVAGLLANDGAEFAAVPVEKWFDRTRPDYADDIDNRRSEELIERMIVLEKLGEYVCKNQVDAGERLYRYAIGEHLVMTIGPWGDFSFEQRQPWETFTSTCRQAFNDLKAAQLAILDVRRAATVTATPGLAREDSIFEEVEDMFALRPEAVEGLRLSGIYQRGQDAEKLRLENVAWDQMRADAEAENAEWIKFGGDPSKFDHDGDGRAGGSRKGGRRTPAKPGQPLSAGEPVARQPVNRGGRGNKKTV